MVCKNRGIYGFLGLSWVLITYNICPPVNIAGGGAYHSVHAGPQTMYSPSLQQCTASVLFHVKTAIYVLVYSSSRKKTTRYLEYAQGEEKLYWHHASWYVCAQNRAPGTQHNYRAVRTAVYVPQTTGVVFSFLFPPSH